MKEHHAHRTCHACDKTVRVALHHGAPAASTEPLKTKSESHSTGSLTLDRCELNDIVEICSDELDTSRYLAAVGHPSAGAVSSFIGTTRDTFDGKKVIRLEYEAYEDMASRKMAEIIQLARSQWPLIRVAVVHRVGVVPVGHASVLVAASSVHRRESLAAVAFLIDEVKARVPIWKKEFYEANASEISTGQCQAAENDEKRKEESSCGGDGFERGDSVDNGRHCCDHHGEAVDASAGKENNSVATSCVSGSCASKHAPGEVGMWKRNAEWQMAGAQGLH